MLKNPILADWPMQPGDGEIVFEAIEESRGLFEQWFLWAPHAHIVDDFEKEARKFYAQFILRKECHLLAFAQGQLVAGCSLHVINWKNLSSEIGYRCRISS